MSYSIIDLELIKEDFNYWLSFKKDDFISELKENNDPAWDQLNDFELFVYYNKKKGMMK